jgi:hypothetical protein
MWLWELEATDLGSCFPWRTLLQAVLDLQVLLTRFLTFWSLLVIMCTTCCNNQSAICPHCVFIVWHDTVIFLSSAYSFVFVVDSEFVPYAVRNEFRYTGWFKKNFTLSKILIKTSVLWWRKCVKLSSAKSLEKIKCISTVWGLLDVHMTLR